MSLSVDGVWKTGVWATTCWADGVWREGEFSGGAGGISRIPWFRGFGTMGMR